MLHTLRFGLIGTLATLALATGTQPAIASPSDDLQQQVDSIIARFGGEQTAKNEITWDDGEAILTLAPAGIQPLSVGSCTTGNFCAYSLTNQGGSKLSFTNCAASNSTAALGEVHSVANARSSGSVHAYNGSTSVLTVAAGSYANTAATITRLGC